MGRVSRAGVKDCFEHEGEIYFVISQGDIGRAIGKGGATIRKVSSDLKKRVKVIEFNSDLCKFVANVIHPVRVSEIVLSDGIVWIKDDDRKKKGQIIGRSGSNLAFVNMVVKKFFDVTEVKVYQG